MNGDEIKWRCVFENIRTEFINELDGWKGKDQPPSARLACPTEAVRRREAEAKRTISSYRILPKNTTK